MILQIDKVRIVPKGVPTEVQSDYIENVSRTVKTQKGVLLYLGDGTNFSVERDALGRLGCYDYKDDYDSYVIEKVWLLNNQGKTLKQLI